MISERDLRLAKAIVDPYIGQDIIATAVLGTKLGSMLNENAYREVVNNAQRLIDGTECIPQGKGLGAKAASARDASEKLDGQSQAAPAKDNLEH